MGHTLFLEFIHKLPRHPNHTLVFVIDALDESGDYQSRPVLLKALTDAAEYTPWLKIIITSRPEVDIQGFFDAPMRYDLGADQEAEGDLRTFARSQFNSVASEWHLPTPWPGESLVDKVVSQANGLFIFIKTFVLALRQCADPKECFEATLESSTGTGLGSLYGLYSGILKARVRRSHIAGFQQMIGVLLATAPYRALCEETVAKLAKCSPIS